ncbi:heterogeneous nuclear ribonucleoproteins A1 homolog isoform X1 [Myxocyprinus asiaticus]|uniref:heterogeneous nuclear ribonucleoproteins A1 homolog isoform X1 n=1 Tax=Myxocyprinus asiaticus TaxID=70543 RepID=UPI0022236AFB|nr:heterogeneous nuclear ribonucleoproteins A1 homolog isoform X1 [Myxocyprinus asiaticus]
MESTHSLYIRLPKEYEGSIQEFGEWDHGIVVINLIPCLTETGLRSYFQRFGTITECVIKTDKTSGWPKGVGFFRYSSTEEAEAPEAAGPPHLGGFQTDIYRVVIPKVAEADKNSPIPTLPYKHSHELGMAYKHINSRWLQ